MMTYRENNKKISRQPLIFQRIKVGRENKDEQVENIKLEEWQFKK